MLATIASLAAMACASLVAQRELGDALVSRLSFAVAATTILAFLTTGSVEMSVCLGAVACVCAAVATIDARKLIVPDALVFSLAALACVAPFRPPLIEQMIGATVLGALFVGIRALHQHARGVEGLGLGDVKLAIVSGALLGAQAGLAMVAAAATATALWIVLRPRLASAAGGTALRIEAPFAVGLSAGLWAGCMMRAMAT